MTGIASFATDRDDPRYLIRKWIVDAHRTPVEGARTIPAPDWVWQTVDAVLTHTRGEADHGAGLVQRVITWCAKGDEELRAARVRLLLEIWIGRRAPMLDAFISNAFATDGGPKRHRILRPSKVGRGELIAIRDDRHCVVAIDGVDGNRLVPVDQVRPIMAPPKIRVRDRVSITRSDGADDHWLAELPRVDQA